MAMTNAARQAAWRARQANPKTASTTTRIEALETQLAKLTTRVARIAQEFTKIRNHVPELQRIQRAGFKSPRKPTQAEANRALIQRYLEDRKLAGALPDQRECSTRTGLTRAAVRHHWDSLTREA